MFDTSVYGELLIDLRTLRKIQKKSKDGKIIVYGNSIIRNELRETPKNSKLGNKKKRILLINIYDSFIKKESHIIKPGNVTEFVAINYYKKYRGIGGNISYRDLRNDFLIVASASIKELDIVVSHDRETMLCDEALKAYAIINSQNSLRNPRFIEYNNYKKELNFIDSST